MLLIIHAGLHKTASTFLQALLCRNGQALHEAGVYFEPDNSMLANHSTAWHVRLGNPIGITEHVKLAVSRGQQTMILSSEDFEMMIFDHRTALLIEAAARAAGVTDIEWHFCLRDPGEYFASQYAQLSNHVFIDFVGMFASVLRTGILHVVNQPDRYPPVWDHCFDYETHMTEFAKAIGGAVLVHDFRDADPFPGHGILDRAVGRQISYDLPTKPGALNRRAAPGEVEAKFTAKLDQLLELADLPAATRQFLNARVQVPLEVQAECAAAVSRRFAPGMERLLQMKRLQGGRPVG
jgi:hypothetical protein